MCEKCIVSKSNFEQFVEVQRTGLYNMLGPQARALTSLTRNQWIYIVSNYDKLEKKYK